MYGTGMRHGKTTRAIDLSLTLLLVVAVSRSAVHLVISPLLRLRWCTVVRELLHAWIPIRPGVTARHCHRCGCSRCGGRLRGGGVRRGRWHTMVERRVRGWHRPVLHLLLRLPVVVRPSWTTPPLLLLLLLLLLLVLVLIVCRVGRRFLTPHPRRVLPGGARLRYRRRRRKRIAIAVHHRNVESISQRGCQQLGVRRRQSVEPRKSLLPRPSQSPLSLLLGELLKISATSSISRRANRRSSLDALIPLVALFVILAVRHLSHHLRICLPSLFCRRRRRRSWPEAMRRVVIK